MIKIPSQLNTVTKLSKIVALVLFVALPFIGFLAGKRYQESLCVTQNYAVENTNTALPSKNDTKENWQISDISKDMNWEIQNISIDDNTLYGMYWDTRYSPENDDIVGTIYTNGTLYKSTVKEDEPGYEEITSYMSELSGKLLKAGWTESDKYDNKYIAVPSADGVFGTMYGLVKIDGDDAQYVTYVYEQKFTSWEGFEEGVVCPCSRVLEIFVSDNVNLKEYFEQESAE